MPKTRDVDPFEWLSPADVERNKRIYEKLAEKMTRHNLNGEGLALTWEELHVLVDQIALLHEANANFRTLADTYEEAWVMFKDALARYGLVVDVDEDDNLWLETKDGRRVAGFVEAKRNKETGKVETVAGSETEGAPRELTAH